VSLGSIPSRRVGCKGSMVQFLVRPYLSNGVRGIHIVPYRLVVKISAFHAEDPGSIPGKGVATCCDPERLGYIQTFNLTTSPKCKIRSQLVLVV
jgi:hypothetical protein